MPNILDLINKKSTTSEQPVIDINQLNVQDLEFLLTALKTSTFRGDQLELFYNLVIKLQNQYLALTTKK